jgi:hypothetical protein
MDDVATSRCEVPAAPASKSGLVAVPLIHGVASP